ncbi:MAG TPA: class I SAM-dependent methyltransferase, partial [Nordella sp.]|nr:class I SAM-dependent methyltransferase [Nordella sp.]
MRGSDSLLEIGCGRGVAVPFIAAQLKAGRILAIDRSATAIVAARKAGKNWESAGKAAFRHSALADLTGAEGPFDKVFAINVNLFWTDPRGELPVVRQLLKKTGRLFLFYEPPVTVQRDKIAGLITENFQGSGLMIEKTVKKDDGAPLLCLTC